MAQRHDDRERAILREAHEHDLLGMLKDIGGLPSDYPAERVSFRDEDGMERCPWCLCFMSASETAMDNHVQFDHGGDYWRIWLFMNGRTK